MIFSKIRSFFSLPFHTKLLFAEAVFTSAYVKMTLVFMPFRKVAVWLGSSDKMEPKVQDKKDLEFAEKLRFVIRLCDRYAPWPTECYTRSLTAKLMLKRRKIASTLFFGFGRNEKGEMMGHAWLKYSDLIITGFADFSKFEVHSSFT